MIFKHYYFFDKDTENMIKGKLDKKIGIFLERK